MRSQGAKIIESRKNAPKKRIIMRPDASSETAKSTKTEFFRQKFAINLHPQSKY